MPIETLPIDPYHIKSSYLYDPNTGEITSRRFGRVVGRRSKAGYIVISLDNGAGKRRTVFAHRIAYVFMTATDIPPGKYIDHINRDRSDNRWKNLRLCSHQRNMLNSSRPRANGLPSGVYFNRGSALKPYLAKIKIAGHSKYLGCFDNIEDAKSAFNRAWEAAYE